jgi:poly(3-hydroxybutyrate) depolymerase
MRDPASGQSSATVSPALGAPRRDLWPFVPTALGAMMLAAGVATGHSLATAPGTEHWSLFVLAELEFYGGFWLLCGLDQRITRPVIATFWLGLLGYDLSPLITGQPARPFVGRITTGTSINLGIDLVVLVSLWLWRPSGNGEANIDAHFGRFALSVVVAAAVGVSIDRSGIGQFPIVASAPSGGPSNPMGLDYLLYLPDGYFWSWSRWPLILSLHGSGAIGRDLARVNAEGLPRRVWTRGHLPFIVLAPQSLRGGWDVQALDALLDHIQTRYRVDPTRIYLTGLSMGGFGSWEMGSAYPERFAAIAPICGGGDPSQAVRLKDVPIWAFHGAQDRVVLPSESQRMVEALKHVGGNVKFTLYPAAGHDSWTATYDNPEFFDWLLAHRRWPKMP